VDRDAEAPDTTEVHRTREQLARRLPQTWVYERLRSPLRLPFLLNVSISTPSSPMAKIENLRDLLVHELKDLYSAETQLVKALPKMAKAASDEDLVEAFEEHLEQTKGQVERLERVFEILGEKPRGKTCEAMKGLVAEGEEVISEDATDDVKDAALIAAAQKVEHYEIAGYGTVRTFAQLLGEKEVANLLQETLDEEGETDQKLTEIAESLNVEALAGSDDEEEE
jgi:ferritin-like metal-binding protein YciE